MTILDVCKEEGVQLVRSGTYWKGPCPFHVCCDKYSFTVSSPKNSYYCFSCKRGGSGEDLKKELLVNHVRKKHEEFIKKTIEMKKLSQSNEVISNSTIQE